VWQMVAQEELALEVFQVVGLEIQEERLEE
jgi:hypothetical protein